MSGLAAHLFPGPGRPRLSILNYHRVLPAPDALQPGLIDVACFARQMRWLARCFRVLPLADGIQGLRAGRLPPRAVAITFDDGYADNHDIVLPLLRRLGLHATFFIASGFLDGGRMWNDTVIEGVRHWRRRRLDLPELGISDWPVTTVAERRRAVSGLIERIKHRGPLEREGLAQAVAAGARGPLASPMMTSAQVRALHTAGMGIGGHTRWHPILSVLSADAAGGAIREGRSDLAAITGEAPALFAYPNGCPDSDYSARDARLVAACGFEAAVTTAPGVATPESSLFELPRFTPWDRSTPRFLARLAHSRARLPPAATAAAPITGPARR